MEREKEERTKNDHTSERYDAMQPRQCDALCRTAKHSFSPQSWPFPVFSLIINIIFASEDQHCHRDRLSLPAGLKHPSILSFRLEPQHSHHSSLSLSPAPSHINRPISRYCDVWAKRSKPKQYHFKTDYLSPNFFGSTFSRPSLSIIQQTYFICLLHFPKKKRENLSAILIRPLAIDRTAEL